MIEFCLGYHPHYHCNQCTQLQEGFVANKHKAANEDTSWGAETHKYEDSAVGPSYQNQKPFLK